MAELVEQRVRVPQNDDAYSRSLLSFFGPLLISNDLKVVFRIAEPNLDVLKTVYLGSKRPFSVGECAWAAVRPLWNS
jgi:hypothetical protein